MDSDDLIHSTKKYGKLLLLGTQNGKLLLYDAERNVVLKRLEFPGNVGMIQSITHLDGDEYIIGSSVDTYRVNMKTFQIKVVPDIKTIKQLSVTGSYLFVASARGLVILPRKKEYTQRIDLELY
ncbi:TPA: hypothetical protein R1S83_005900, partial [Klebsiella pneumoniae]|nr:hypothetical protein [Klebsiella pneumoniae]